MSNAAFRIRNPSPGVQWLQITSLDANEMHMEFRPKTFRGALDVAEFYPYFLSLRRYSGLVALRNWNIQY